MGKKKTNKERLFYWLEVNEIAQKKIISKALADSNINYGEFTIVISEEQNCFRSKESIRAKDDQLDDIEWDRLIEHSKRIGQNERQSLKLKTEI